MLLWDLFAIQPKKSDHPKLSPRVTAVPRAAEFSCFNLLRDDF